MKKFKYSARDVKGKVVTGEVEARDSESVTDILHDRGLIVVSIKEGMGIDFEKLAEINIGGVPMKEKVIFMRQMSTMVGAGLPLTRALEIMVQQAGNPFFKRVLKEVLASVQSGRSLSDSFRAQDEIYDEVTLNLIEAGEESGNLETILERLATELEEKNSLSSKLKSAMIYPIIILVVIVVVVVLMMMVLIPSMATIYSDFGAELPWVTRVLMSMSDFFLNFWWAVLVVLAILIIGGKYYLDSAKGKRNWDKLVLKIPVVGGIITKMQLSQFTRILALLLGSGLSIIKALELTASSLSNSIFKDTITEAKTEVEKGGALALPIARSEYFPLLVSSMIAVGEETGEIDAVLTKVSEYYKEEVDVATTNMASVLEPVFLIIMGLAIGFIALGVYMPMFQLSSAIG
ncbi:MAG: Type 4 fimbrial assembly protein PilC [candidate division WS6 bacterium GW2011_GWC1_36_11]|uniref:Type 4 fimbrial assembly protein PilC n=3 Tax=Candidatus Dojkabacteria TaxID=74243 RepID=A0A0G0DGU4_9BACT|nr:MAG: Type 4 fimbrial assembly protein PilC [candidate division WS6 bacterium GW2011_GWC1_36_11]KKQ04705.1 MAG: Type 4 fimbrial assembly protein PilC [candidate division WS6 bacterium GW2011_WS6_36_26]KKQ11307.1 MAG: Type 4 fimbrial assembly protein PilC [candidate division WS6 bacterium GW2011_GWE1_36_69]KKQ11778.1 MAG: Type 4 fimbrial assembly protein PilC [candidate division WS6 bacterium GW2011_GWC2_36_7]KKQ17906.1 MAG: Type 4 fimbrial assembly protein PilC [candidate division WS6 bacteri